MLSVTRQAADLFFFNDPLLSLLQEGALGIFSSHDGRTPTSLQVGRHMLLLYPTPLLHTHPLRVASAYFPDDTSMMSITWDSTATCVSQRVGG